jgi:alpha/beta superfamily hydrolase
MLHAAAFFRKVSSHHASRRFSFGAWLSSSALALTFFHAHSLISMFSAMSITLFVFT